MQSRTFILISSKDIPESKGSAYLAICKVAEKYNVSVYNGPYTAFGRQHGVQGFWCEIFADVDEVKQFILTLDRAKTEEFNAHTFYDKLSKHYPIHV